MNSNQATLAPRAQGISRRAYNGLAFGLVTASFALMFAMYFMVQNGTLNFLFESGVTALITLIVSLVGTIAGIVVMGRGKKSQSVATTLIGYTIFSLTFGLTLALGLARYTTATITVALGITVCLAGIFLIAGLVFPEFFAAIGRVLMLALIAVIVIELICVLFLHVDQTIFDYIVIAIFCGFIGYDSYQLAIDDPTVPNAIWHASDIYIDIANVLIRVLDIMDRR